MVRPEKGRDQWNWRTEQGMVRTEVVEKDCRAYYYDA